MKPVAGGAGATIRTELKAKSYGLGRARSSGIVWGMEYIFRVKITEGYLVEPTFFPNGIEAEALDCDRHHESPWHDRHA